MTYLTCNHWWQQTLNTESTKSNLSKNVMTAEYASSNTGLGGIYEALVINIFGNEVRVMTIVIRYMLLTCLVLMI